jgi:hypothetical protein
MHPSEAILLTLCSTLAEVLKQTRSGNIPRDALPAVVAHACYLALEKNQETHLKDYPSCQQSKS